MQLLTGILSSQTVQLEQTPRSQLIFVPVMLSWMRRASARVVRGSISRACSLPLMCNVTRKRLRAVFLYVAAGGGRGFAVKTLHAFEQGGSGGGDASAFEKAATGDAGRG